MADPHPSPAPLSTGSVDPDSPPEAHVEALKAAASASTSHAELNTSTKRNVPATAPHNGSRGSALARNVPSTGPSSGLQSLSVSRSPSIGASPRSSRDSSPAGPTFRRPSSTTATSSASRGMRSRTNSHEVSPQRQSNPSSTVLSAAAIQRALSRDSIPPLQPAVTSDPSSRIPRSQKSSASVEGRDVPSWPVSPRLKSPPPASSARRSSSRGQRKPLENSSTPGPDIVLQRPSPESTSENTSTPLENASQRVNSTRNSGNNVSTLETVEESITPGALHQEPAAANSEELRHEYFSFTSDEERPLTALHDSEASFSSNTPKASGSNKASPRKRPTDEHKGDPDATPKAKIASKIAVNDMDVKSPSEPTVKNMIVETETVSSVPQATLAPNDRVSSGRVDPGGTIRVKASNETIRPKKERRKAAKKGPSNAAFSSSRADIFEDRVKNAMDEATSDDSDETFVYESNPPEAPARRSRNHSRTPSVTSLSSMPERSIMRSIVNAIDQRVVPKARSMKFASNNSNYGTADEDLESGNGTIRARDRNGTNNLHQHFRGQRVVTGQSAQPEEETNIVPLSKTKSLTAVGGRGSYAARLAAQNLRHTGSVKRSDGYSSMDLEAEGADDERTPLIGTVRTPRTNRSSRRQYRYADLNPTPQEHRRSLIARFAGCLLILITVSLLTFGVVCFLFAMSKPLVEVSVVDLKNVIASEQELMMDVVIQAVNPNLVPITVSDLDVNLFARSKYVGSEKWWREHGPEPINGNTDDDNPERKEKLQDSSALKHDHVLRREQMAVAQEGIIISDPPPHLHDPSSGQTMLLGHITHFDNPLSFDGSFWRRQPHFATGSLRLSKPGNHTEAGGTERWERVLKHDFDLIIRGVLSYNIPLGGKTISVPISGETPVEGNGGKDDADTQPRDGDTWFR